MIDNIKFGFNARAYGDYFYSWTHEVKFARENGFEFIQLYVTGKSDLSELHERYGEIKKINFPVIIHAVLEIDDINKYLSEIVGATADFDSEQLIIHPVNSKGLTIENLSTEVKQALEYLVGKSIGLYLENNSRLDPIFHSVEELNFVFQENPQLNFLLDLAHIDDYEHLKEMIAIRNPGILHVSDRDLSVIHDHLPIGRGNIDFRKIFTEILPNFSGKMIFELSNSDQEIVESKDIISNILRQGG